MVGDFPLNERLFRRDAETNTRDACATQNYRAATELRCGSCSVIEKWRRVAFSADAVAPLVEARVGGVSLIPTILLTPCSSFVTPLIL